MSKILPFPKVDAFDPELTQVMSEGFELAWDALCGNAHRAPVVSDAIATREIMARRIIYLAKQGVKDMFHLSAEAIKVVLASRVFGSPRSPDRLREPVQLEQAHQSPA